MTQLRDLLNRLAIAALAVVTWTTFGTAERGMPDGEWPLFGGDAGNTRHSPLDRIDATNVRHLQIAWRWNGDEIGPRVGHERSGFTPIMIDGVLFTTAGDRRAAVAIDAGTGRTLWTYRFGEIEPPEHAPGANPDRGLAYWRDRTGARVFVITPAFRLIALDAGTGRPRLDFGARGVVDLLEGATRPGRPIVDHAGLSTPPLVVNDVVVVGLTLPDGRSTAGQIRGYDRRTGQQLWVFHTLPRAGELGPETCPAGVSSASGSPGIWTPLAADEERGYVYATVGAAAGCHGGRRPGDNLFSQTLICLNARTGERVWHFQFVHHAVWDDDPPAPPIVVDLELKSDGRPHEVVVQVTKQAFVYILDRRTGVPVWPVLERPVPQSDAPGEQTSPTQPFPTRPAPIDRQHLSVDDLIDFTPELRAAALDAIAPYRLGLLFTPPSAASAPDGTKGTIQFPGRLGGANWTGGAVDTETGFLYVGSATAPSLEALHHGAGPAGSSTAGVHHAAPQPLGLPLVKPPWGRITALDLNSAEWKWTAPNGNTPDDVRNHPALRNLEIPATGRPIQTALMVTRELLFATGGWQDEGDPVLRAHDNKTGQLVAEIALPGRPVGAPMTYQLGQRQYVAVMIAGPDRATELVALTLAEVPGT